MARGFVVRFAHDFLLLGIMRNMILGAPAFDRSASLGLIQIRKCNRRKVQTKIPSERLVRKKA